MALRNRVRSFLGLDVSANLYMFITICYNSTQLKNMLNNVMIIEA